MQQAAEALLAGEMAPPCLDVTLALRYMTHNGRITFHQVCAGTSWCYLFVIFLAFTHAVCFTLILALTQHAQLPNRFIDSDSA